MEPQHRRDQQPAETMSDTLPPESSASGTTIISDKPISEQLREWAEELGFAAIGITDCDMRPHDERLNQWLAREYHGEMNYMSHHADLRKEPGRLHEGIRSIISLRMEYRPQAADAEAILEAPEKAYISRYALGRDYHKLIRKRLASIAKRLEHRAGGQHRAFVDSAPVLERGVAEKAGLGWIGKNTMLLNSKAGSWFFLGEIYTTLELPRDTPQQQGHCGSCSACLSVCPTDAFTGPWELDARRCISYLTIELKGSIPEELRPMMGNRVFGCDDCQLVCPWNKFSPLTAESDFQPRHQLDDSDLCELFLWTEDEFLKRTEGSPIRRIGFKRWLRNIAVALGNAPTGEAVLKALKQRVDDTDPVVREHVHWALAQHPKH